MTTTASASPDGETYNPESAKTFAETLGINQGGVAQSCEASEAALAGHVDGEALTLLAGIKERSNQSAADAQKLSAIFAKQIEAAEAARAAGVKADDYLTA